MRLEIANPRQLLKPAMFAQVELPVGGKAKVLTVPNSAVIDSGTRRIVLVQLAEGRFEPREVKLGSRTDNYVEVMDGVKDGEQVVVAANFLIDAESNLKAAIGGFGHSGQGGTPGAGATPHLRRRRPRRLQRAASTAGGAIASAPGTKSPVVGHRAEGTVKAVDAKSGIAVRRARARRNAQMARDDDGLQGRQQCASRRPETGDRDCLRVRRAVTGRMGDHEDHAAQRSRPAPTPSPPPAQGH